MGKEREEKEKKKKKKGRKACCSNEGLRKGSWTPEEDNILVDFITKNGHGTWRNLPKLAGLLRCGKSCRLRWTNYLRPDIKRGPFSPDEETQIIHLQRMLGYKWAAIASHLPGRTDNDVKNFWNSHLRKRFALDQPSSSLPAPSDTPKSRGDYFLNLWNSNIGESFRNVNEGARPASHSTTSSSLTEQKGEVVIKCKKEVEDSYDMDDSSDDAMMKLLLLDFPVGDNDMGFLGPSTGDHGSTYISD